MLILFMCCLSKSKHTEALQHTMETSLNVNRSTGISFTTKLKKMCIYAGNTQVDITCKCTDMNYCPKNLKLTDKLLHVSFSQGYSFFVRNRRNDKNIL